MSAIMRLAAVGFFSISAVLGLTAEVAGQVREPQRPEIRGVIAKVDTASATITVAIGGGRETAAEEKTYSLAKNVEVAIGGGFTTRLGGVCAEGKLADLTAGIMVSLALAADQKTVDSILAEEPLVRGLIKKIDAAAKTLTISQTMGREQEPDDKTFTLAPQAEIAVDDGRGRPYSLKEGKLEDLAPGALVTLRLSLDKREIRGVLAEGSTLSGIIKSLDPAKSILTLILPPVRGEEAAQEKTLPLAGDAVVLLDDGKGRRLSLREGKLADAPLGALATVKLAADQTFVMHLRIEGPTLTGLLKAVDPVKNTITIAIPKNRIEADEKTLVLAKDARIVSDGVETKLANLKVGDNGLLLQLRLSIDQKMVQAVRAGQPQRR